MSLAKLANESWEALFRAQVLLMRQFAADNIWNEVTQAEYDVLYTLSQSPHGLSLVELNRTNLMTQGGVSKLVLRLQQRKLVERTANPADRRASRIVLSAQGRKVQRRVGRRHAQTVTAVMTAALDEVSLVQLRDLGTRIAAVQQSRTIEAVTDTLNG